MDFGNEVFRDSGAVGPELGANDVQNKVSGIVDSESPSSIRTSGDRVVVGWVDQRNLRLRSPFEISLDGFVDKPHFRCERSLSPKWKVHNLIQQWKIACPQG